MLWVCKTYIHKYGLMPFSGTFFFTLYMIKHKKRLSGRSNPATQRGQGFLCCYSELALVCVCDVTQG